MSTHLIISYCAGASVILPFVCFLLRWRLVKAYNPYLFFYIINHFLSEVVIFGMALRKMRNLEAMVLVNSIEGVLLLLIYLFAFSQEKYKKVMRLALPIFLAGYWLIYFIWDFNSYLPSHVFAFQHLVMLIPLILYFAERMRLLDDANLLLNPMFWVTSGFLIFYSISIFYFTLINDLFIHYREIFIKGAIIHSIALVIMNIFLARGLWLIRKV